MDRFWAVLIGIVIGAEIWAILSGQTTISDVLWRLTNSPPQRILFVLLVTWASYHILWDRQ
jgi:hypothetical protein